MQVTQILYRVEAVVSVILDVAVLKSKAAPLDVKIGPYLSFTLFLSRFNFFLIFFGTQIAALFTTIFVTFRPLLRKS